MSLLDGSARAVLEATEVVAMVTEGPDGPHLTATWGDYVRTLGIEGDRLVAPAGFMRRMEANLAANPAIQLLVASRSVQGSRAPGQGFTLKGTARIVTDGPEADRVRANFPWARGALIVDVTEAVSHL